MGVGIPGEASLPVEGDLGNEEGGEEDAVEEEEELSVHHFASTGDVEVCQRAQFWNLIAFVLLHVSGDISFPTAPYWNKHHISLIRIGF
jgi:hypothetical protein